MVHVARSAGVSAGIRTASRSPRPALQDATAGLTRELGFGPRLSSDEAGWRDVSLRWWRGERETCRYAPFDELLLVFHTGGGSMQVNTDGRWSARKSLPGRLTVVPPGTPLDWRIVGGIDGWTLHLPKSRFTGLLDGDAPDRLLERIGFDFAIEDRFLYAAVQVLADGLRSADATGPLFADSLADTIGLHLARPPRRGSSAGAGAGLSRGALRRVTDYMEASLGSSFGLDELARAVGTSRSVFTRAFRVSTGTSPHRFVLQRRIERARERLGGSTDALADIAADLGFSSQSHFCSTFRASTGLTPLQYRRQHR